MNQLCSFRRTLLSPRRLFWVSQEKLLLCIIILFNINSLTPVITCCFSWNAIQGFIIIFISLTSLLYQTFQLPAVSWKSFAFSLFFHKKSLTPFYLVADTIECIFQQPFFSFGFCWLIALPPVLLLFSNFSWLNVLLNDTDSDAFSTCACSSWNYTEQINRKKLEKSSTVTGIKLKNKQKPLYNHMSLLECKTNINSLAQISQVALEATFDEFSLTFDVLSLSCLCHLQPLRMQPTTLTPCRDIRSVEPDRCSSRALVQLHHMCSDMRLQRHPCRCASLHYMRPTACGAPWVVQWQFSSVEGVCDYSKSGRWGHSAVAARSQ